MRVYAPRQVQLLRGAQACRAGDMFFIQTTFELGKPKTLNLKGC